MRDERWKTVHRGGLLSPARHRLLATWAADCAEHVLPLFCDQYPEDDRPQKAIEAARAWACGEITVGEARAQSVAAHTAARQVSEAKAQYVARAAGHAVATAHMADHAPGTALYALKALKAVTPKQSAARAVEHEQAWQKERLPEEIRELVTVAFEQKYSSFGL